MGEGYPSNLQKLSSHKFTDSTVHVHVIVCVQTSVDVHRCMGSILSISANTSRRSSDAAMNISFRGVPGKDLNSMKSGNALIFFK